VFEWGRNGTAQEEYGQIRILIYTMCQAPGLLLERARIYA